MSGHVDAPAEELQGSGRSPSGRAPDFKARAGAGASAALSRWIARAGIGLEVALSGLRAGTAAAGGHRVAYLESRAARTGGETIVLLHGFGGDKLNWVRHARHLVAHYRVIIPDLPGFGDSERRPDRVYSTDNQAGWLAALLDALDANRVHLAGNSMGGHVATRFAARYPERVRSLILHAPAGTAGAGPPWDTSRLGRGHHPVLVATPAEFDALIRWTFVKPPWLPGPLRRYLAERALAHPGFTQKVFADIMRPEAGNGLVEPLLPTLAQPTLVIWGDGDRLLDCQQAHVYERLMPDARAIVLRDCGHLPMAERPRETAQLTLAFLQSRSFNNPGL